MDELAARGALAEQTARFFRNRDGSALRLYRHQVETLEIARQNDP